MIQTHGKIFAGSSFVSFYTSLVAVVMFLSILTSGCRERDFCHTLPWKLLLGLIAFYISIASTLVSFTTRHFFIFRNQLRFVSSTSYIVTSALVTLFSMAVFPLCFHLVWATLKKVPQPKYIQGEYSSLAFGRLTSFYNSMFFKSLMAQVIND